MKRKIFTLLSAAVLLLCNAAMAQNVVFVSPSGNNSNSGATWLLAKGPTYLQTLTGTTVPANTKIYLKTGTYTYNQVNGIGINNGGFQLKGGYPTAAGATDTSGYDAVNNPTTINLTTTSTIYVPFLANPSANISTRIMGIQFVGPSTTGAIIFYGTVGSITTNFDFSDDIFSNFGVPSGGGYQPFITQNAGTYNFYNCIFHDNGAANDGAAIDIISQTAVLNIDKCSFYNNKSATGQQGGGGAVASVAPTNTITNSFFCNNSAPSGAGGAIGTGANSGGASVENFTITNCTFSKNSCGTYFGGAVNIHSNTGSVLNMTGCNFYQNSNTGGTFGGGALSFYVGQVATKIKNCNFYNNTITSAISPSSGGAQGGGAILIFGNTSTTTDSIINCVFDNNIVPAASYGGAIEYSNGFSVNNNIAIDQCTFVNNQLGTSTSASGSDIGLYQGGASDGHFTVTNSKMQLSALTTTYYKPYTTVFGTNGYTFNGSGNTSGNTSGGLSSPTFTCPTSLSGIQILPVTFTSFTATLQNNAVNLNWATATETNNKGFAIERSSDGINFTQIDFISSQANNGNSSALLNYTSTDASPLAGINYYRLKQVDFDAKSTYSSIATVLIGASKNLSLGVYPNPVSSNSKVIIGGVSNFSSAYLTVVNGIGQAVQKLPVTQTVVGIDFNSLPHGIYHLLYTDAAGNLLQTKLVK